MKHTVWHVSVCGWLMVGLVSGLVVDPVAAAEKEPFHIKALYVEGCSCGRPCACQLTGIEPGCLGVNAIQLSAGQFQGVDLAGVKVAFATAPEKWVRLYVDVPNPEQRAAAVAFARAYTGLFGTIEQVTDAPVKISGENGRYELTVDDGKVMRLVTEPVLGGDGKTPLVYSNIHDPLHPTVKQGKTVTGTYDDGTHKFELSDSNAYFNESFQTTGEL